MDSPGAAYTQFGFNLFQKLNKIQDGNIFFSPVGISAAIGMLVLEAREAAAVQLQKMLFSEKDAESSRVKIEEKMVRRQIDKTEEIHYQFQEFLDEICKPTSDYELKITNKLFGEKTYLFLQKYLDYVEKYYHASLEPVDFVNAADETRKKINSWVESQTNEKIKDLFPDGSVNSFTKLVLVNIVYFKGQWDKEFKKENTKEEEFWLNKSTSKSVPMMTQCHSFSFTFLEDLQAQILGIPYKNNDLSMFVLLPNDIDGLDKIEKQLNAKTFYEWTSSANMVEREVEVHIPRFRLEIKYELNSLLNSLGMTDIFNEIKADLSGISPVDGLYLSKVIHKSYVDVNEEGTEAAAATGDSFLVKRLPIRAQFLANHPFLFFIRHSHTNTILFCGKLASP
ncbi:serpin B13-like isoform X2 [Enhydra lutris kenyoni]|uniref:Serpin B10 n=1 Tax=Enhydra lutris kenyoni TaxID=391180 RepID=A0A2Y9KCY8_ENHLU|nr:serpin B13-like isoform X2 [Enhydra lutris kenyoni]